VTSSDPSRRASISARAWSSFVLAICLSAAHGVALAAPDAGRYLKAADIDLRQMIPDAPSDDSLATRADLETVVNVQQRRTSEQVVAAVVYDKQQVFQNDDVIGPWFNARNLPQTAAFFAQVAADRFAISSKGKEYWNRPRPPLIDARVKPAIELPTTGAYPSGHSTQAFVNAGLLAEIFPELRDALREHARQVAWSRVIAGVHYPTDTAAGQMLGERLAKEFLKNPDVRAALDRVRGEVEPFRKMAVRSVSD
jgi:acid phosphatase (class A)